MKARIAVLAIGAAVFISSRMDAVADNIIFTIDSSQSSFTLSGFDRQGNVDPYQAQPGNSLTTPVSGHFVVNFDSSNDNPQSIQFIGGNTVDNGFFQLANSGTALPGIGGSGPAAPANLAGQTASSGVSFAIRNLTYNFSSSPLSPAAPGGNSFSASSTSFYVLSGGIDGANSVTHGSESYTGASDHLSGGTWTLSESGPGTGDWTLTSTIIYNYNGGVDGGPLSVSATTVSTAHYGGSNVVTVPSSPSTPVTLSVLGGSDSLVPGGVTVTLPAGTSGGTLTVQQLSNAGALTPQEIAAAAANPVFAASLFDPVTQTTLPIQAWTVDYPPELPTGQTATVVFHFDPTKLPAGASLANLGVWHFSSVTNSWNFGGTVDPNSDTISYVTDSFSPFVLGVPEPSSLMLAGMSMMGLFVVAWRGRRQPVT